MRPPPRPQQRSQSVNASPQAQTPKPQIATSGKRGRSSNKGRTLLQTTSGNASRFTTPAKSKFLSGQQLEVSTRTLQPTKDLDPWIPSASCNITQENPKILL